MYVLDRDVCADHELFTVRDPERGRIVADSRAHLAVACNDRAQEVELRSRAEWNVGRHERPPTSGNAAHMRPYGPVPAAIASASLAAVCAAVVTRTFERCIALSSP